MTFARGNAQTGLTKGSVVAAIVDNGADARIDDAICVAVNHLSLLGIEALTD